MNTISDALANAASQLAAAGIEGARREARALLAHWLGISPDVLPMLDHAPIAVDAIDALVARRAAREPLEQIIGFCEFWSRRFAVTNDILVPRRDSETLIESAVEALPSRKSVSRVLDLGTGTGCLLLAALVEFPAAFGIGVDNNSEAAILARCNAAALKLADRAAFLCGNWAAALGGRFDLVLCNPPYVPISDIQSLMPEVGLYEPISALSGGPDGLDAYKAVLPVLPSLLTPKSIAVLELGDGQRLCVEELAVAHGFILSVRRDLAGIERAMVLQLEQ